GFRAVFRSRQRIQLGPVRALPRGRAARAVGHCACVGASARSSQCPPCPATNERAGGAPWPKSCTLTLWRVAESLLAIRRGPDGSIALDAGCSVRIRLHSSIVSEFAWQR